MAFLIIDRRLNGKHKSAVNRQRFLRRYRKHIKEAVSDAIKKRSITDIERGEEISIPKRDVSEPTFHHGRGGRQTRIFPGNKEFVTGDRIKRPKGGGSGEVVAKPVIPVRVKMNSCLSSLKQNFWTSCLKTWNCQI